MGDKTILDAMVPAVDSLADSLAANPQVATDGDLALGALGSAISSSAAAVVATRDLQSQRGRASWLQDRSIGLQDPGATAFLRALEAWRDAATGERGPRGRRGKPLRTRGRGDTRGWGRTEVRPQPSYLHAATWC